MQGSRIWSQSVARRALMGPERTHNPSPAASYLLGQRYGGSTVRAVVARLNKRRRSAHRGNPLPALVGGELLSHIPGLGGLFKTPSAKRAKAVAGALVTSAVNGNLTAAKAIIERTKIGIQSERAVWKDAARQIPQNIVALLAKFGDQVPSVDHSTPESAAQDALDRAVDGKAMQAHITEAASAAAHQRHVENLSLVQSGIGTLGTVATALARGSRRPARRRRRRY